jgi:eukaryotic-like serine/threonine-protein kinase
MKNLIGALFQHYLLLEPLHLGLDFAYFEAVEAASDHRVLLEVIFPGRQTSSDFTNDFLEIVRQLAGITHPAILPVLEAGHTDLGHFIAFDLDPAGWQNAVLRPGKALELTSPTTAAVLCAQLADALQVLHECGLAHGCLSPESLLLVDEHTSSVKTSDTIGPRGTRPQVYVLNAGLAPVINREIARWAPESLFGLGIGNLAYFAPERVLGRGPSSAADIYALGMIYAALVTGQPLLDQGGTTEMAFSLVTRPLRWPKRLPQVLPRGAKDFICNCTASASKARYKSAAQAKMALSRLAGKAYILPAGAGGDQGKPGTVEQGRAQ